MIRSHQIIYAAIGAGVLGFAVVALILAPVGEISQEAVEALFYGSAATSVAGVIAAFLVQQRAAESVATATSEEQALGIVFSKGIVSIALVEASALVAIIGLLLTADQTFLTFLIPFVVVYALLFPTPTRLGRRLGR